MLLYDGDLTVILCEYFIFQITEKRLGKRGDYETSFMIANGILSQEKGGVVFPDYFEFKFFFR